MKIDSYRTKQQEKLGTTPDRSTIFKPNDSVKGLINAYYKNLDLEDFSENHRKIVKRVLNSYLSFCHGDITLDKTIEHLTVLKSRYDSATYNKHYFQIKKFLRFLEVSWVDKIPKARPKVYQPKKVTNEQLENALIRFKDDLQVIALLRLGCASGLRAMELYQLNPEDIDLERRIVYVKSDAKHSVKNQGSVRESYFDCETQALKKYRMSGVNHMTSIHFIVEGYFVMFC